MNSKQLARGLGWFSIGLGLAEVIVPRQLGKLIGVKGHEGTLRAFGLREIAAGIGLLASRYEARPLSRWMWARVGGDALDMAAMGAMLKANQGWIDGKRRTRNWAAMGAVAPVVAADIFCAQQLSAQAGEF